MSDHFLDTSALVKHYHPETGTPKVDLLWATPGARLFISRLGAVEAVSVFAKKVRSGIITAADFALLRRRFFADLRRRRPILVRLLVRHYQEADRLLGQHGLSHSLHTLDAIQLAVALDLRQRGMLTEMVTADRTLLAVAPLEGLVVSNPEVP
jgi:predicted nucleic acid-binding protein